MSLTDAGVDRRVAGGGERVGHGDAVAQCRRAVGLVVERFGLLVGVGRLVFGHGLVGGCQRTAHGRARGRTRVLVCHRRPPSRCTGRHISGGAGGKFCAGREGGALRRPDRLAERHGRPLG